MANKKETAKRLVLKVGEGLHSHALEAETDFEYERKGEGTNASITMLLKGTGVITHEEHHKIALKSGRYSQTSQVEFDPFNGALRNVYD